ncbi:hypothetical protein [Sphingomonas sp. CROZ-RG-20F-R02-07]|uniref:hypothetical protein n=1 Tax=Sphingomonas sp. CROZ-RG-20F-R02-07 TaxID=2914832 RepID=UPI001F5A1F03|nr:hypothetical protein [Sphingomonas sp. CROZ-RG-20F-R02-07]
MPISATPDAIVRDAEWLPHRYDATLDMVQFLRVDRATRRSATFLTDEYLPAGLPLEPLPRKAVLGMRPDEAPLRVIFHSAFCCSTLLANALDLPGIATSLKEPVILNDVVGFRHRGGTRADAERLLDDTLALLARPFASGEAVVIKPSNIVNGFAAAIMALRPEATALLLHAPLPVFLGSVAKKGLWGRLWVRQLFLGLAKDGMLPFNFGQDEYFGQSDLQIAALCWLAQQALFAGMAQRFGARVRTLDSEAVTRRSREVTVALGAHFSLALSSTAVDGIVAGPAFTRHSKFGTVFGDAARAAEVADAGVLHADELDKVAIWATAVADAHGIPLVLASSLLG